MQEVWIEIENNLFVQGTARPVTFPQGSCVVEVGDEIYVVDETEVYTTPPMIKATEVEAMIEKAVQDRTVALEHNIKELEQELAKARSEAQIRQHFDKTESQEENPWEKFFRTNIDPERLAPTLDAAIALYKGASNRNIADDISTFLNK